SSFVDDNGNASCRHGFSSGNTEMLNQLRLDVLVDSIPACMPEYLCLAVEFFQLASSDIWNKVNVITSSCLTQIVKKYLVFLRISETTNSKIAPILQASVLKFFERDYFF